MPTILHQNKTIMSILFLLILISISVAVFFLGAFFWAVRMGQYDDEYTPAVRILLEEENPQKETK